MALTRYNFPVQCKIKEGRMKKSPYTVGFFQDDAQAEAFRVSLQSILANKAKVGTSKAIVAVGNEELADPENPTDIFDVKVLARYVSPIDATIKSDLETIMIPNVAPGWSDADITNLVKTMWTKDNGGTERQLNVIYSVTKISHNVALMAADDVTAEQPNPITK